MANPQDNSQLYLIFGNNVVEVGNERHGLVTKLLTPEERDTGLTEITGPGNQALTLARAYSEIIGELGTTSFIAGAKRVCVVYNLKELFGSSTRKSAPQKPKKKASVDDQRMAALIEWFRDVLPTTENIAIFVCQESDEKQRLVSGHSPLYQFIKKHGTVIEHREKALNTDFEDRLYDGDAVGAIDLFRQWMRRSGGDSSARSKMFFTLSNVVEMVFQARCLREAEDRGIPRGQVQPEGYPVFTKLGGEKRRGAEKLAARIPLWALRRILEEMNQLQRFMYPSGQENYVPDWEDCFETIVMELAGMKWPSANRR